MKRFFRRESSLKKMRESSFDNSQFSIPNKEELEYLKNFRVHHPSPSIKTIEEA